MENMEVFIYPKEIHISTPSTLSLRLTYKKIAISTNHQLEKYQNRQSFPIRNSVAIINDQVKFKLSKQFELNNTKIVIVVIGIKGREIVCLGDISLDLPTLRDKSSKSLDSFKVKIDKCKDPKAYLEFQIKFVQKPIDINQLKKSRKEKQKQAQKIPQLGIIKTDYYYKQELYISRRQKQDKPTAYQISRKNYKHNEITRNNNTSAFINNKTVSKQKRLSNDSLKENSNNGSYKKRFMYDVKRNQKSRDRSHTKQLGSNYLKVYQKDKSPSPRIKTPQPITLEAMKYKQTHGRTQSKVQPLNLSGVDNYKVESDLVDPDTFRAHPSTHSQYPYTENFTNNQPQQNISRSNISVSSISSINNEKDSKYKMITQKLQMIESKIREQKDKYTQGHDQQRSNKGSKLSKSQIQQIDSYAIGQDSKKYSPNMERININKQRPISPFQDTQIYYQKRSQSPSQSTCPRNQRAPSPIHQAVQTPQVFKRQPQSVKMSEFTISSRKNQVTELQQQKSPQNESISQSNVTTSKTFEKITSPSMNTQQHKQSSRGPSPSPRVGSREKREISPALSFQKRESQLKMQKKSSLGRNYIETQVKMLELQIQQKDMKYERLEKKYTKKQQECTKLTIINEQLQKRVIQVSNNLLQTKSRVLQLERESQQMQLLSQKLREKQQQITKQQQEIKRLNTEIQNLALIPRQQQKQTENKVLKTHDQEVQIDYIDESLKYKKVIEQKQSMIQSLNSQLQTYLNQISCLRQRTQELYQIKQNYNQLNLKYQQNLQLLKQKQKQKTKKEKEKDSPIDKLESSNFKSQYSQSPQNSSRQNLSAQSSKSTQELLQQTIQKQSLLQQSLKSLQNQNKTLTENVKSLQNQNKSLNDNIQTVQQEKDTLQQKVHSYEGQNKQLKQQLLALQQQIASSSTKHKSTKAIQTQYELKLRQLENQRDLLSEKLSRKQKTIQKLSTLNESLNSKIFHFQQENNTKFNQLNQQTDLLVLKNAQNQQLINQFKQKLNSKQKQMNILKQLLRDRQDQEIKEMQQRKKQMRRDPSSESQRSTAKKPRVSEKFRGSKSDQLIKVKVTQEGKENFYQSFMNEKARSTNLEAQLRYAQNDMRNLKMKIDLLTQEKKDLQQEIDMIAYNNTKDLAKQGLKHKMSMQNNSISESVKLQNKALKQEIKLLQSQVQDLNILLDSAIQRTANFQASQIASILNNPQMQNKIMNQKYVAMARRLQAYEMQLRTKKNKMAEIVNAIWRGGNATLIDQIDRIMGTDQ